MSSRDIKQVIVMRKDLKCRRGKEIAQGSHASLAFLTRFSQIDGDTLSVKLKNTEEVQQWLQEGFTKICVSVDSESELDSIYQLAIDAGLNVHMIIDSGLTEFHGVKTKTCLAIGPNKKVDIDKITSGLKLL
jgi:PTH2 family peptidyl-tRNA hydrolase